MGFLLSEERELSQPADGLARGLGQQRQLQKSDPLSAAAVGHEAREAPTETDISAAVAELHNADAGTIRQVEPLARQLPRDRFEEVVETVRIRRLSNVVRNDAGLMVHLLRLELEQLKRTSAPAVQAPGTAVPSRIERLKREDPEEYARRLAAHFEAMEQGRKRDAERPPA
jgi:hypothetical protein